MTEPDVEREASRRPPTEALEMIGNGHPRRHPAGTGGTFTVRETATIGSQAERFCRPVD